MTGISMNNPYSLFIDTSAFIALLNPRDQYHDKMREYLETLKGELRGITSNLVLGELLTFFSRHGSLKGALDLQKTLLSDPRFQVIWVDRELHELSSQILNKYSDQQISFADASSFAIMKTERIQQALTFDSDFSRAGFEVVP
jgi:predicted nucleic acid-binding protein